MKAFITGITGFVGPHLSSRLLENNCNVYGIDRAGGEIEGCKTFSCDLLDKKRLFGILSDTKPDCIFHLAAQSSVLRSWSEPELTKQINVNGTKNLFEAAHKYSPKAKILVVSSSEVYGIQKKFPINENAPLNPISPYAESRLEQEKLAMDFFKRGMDIVISRSFSHIGPGQKEDFVCSSFAKQVVELEKAKRKSIEVGNLSSERDFTDVRDIAEAYSLALEKGASGEIYNICSGKTHSIKEILDILILLSGKKIRIMQKEDRVRKVDIPKLLGDNSKFRKQTGWRPKIPLNKTLKDLLSYWRERV